MTYLRTRTYHRSNPIALVATLLVSIALSLTLSHKVSAQDVEILPDDLFENPQESIEEAREPRANVDSDFSDLFETSEEGVEYALPRTSRDAESWKDYTHLSLRASVSNESNLFLDGAGNEQDDIIFRIAPTLSFTTPGLGSEDRTLSLSYTPSYRMYSNNSDLNDLDHTFRFKFNNDAQLRFPKTTVNFDLGYDQTQSSDRLNGGLVGRDRLHAGVNVNHRLTGKTNLNFSANGESNSYENRNTGANNNGDLLDDITWNVRASMTYQVTGKISVGPYVGYGVSDISGSAGGVANTQDRYSYSAGITGTYNATGKTVLTGSIGWSKYEFDGPNSGSGNDSLTYRIGVSHQLSSRTSMRAAIWQDYKPSNSVADTSYIATGASLSLNWRQSDQWGHYLSLTYENDDYFTSSAAGGRGDSDYFRISLGTDYRFYNGLTLGARISSSTQNNNSRIGNETLNDFENWIFSIYANYIFW
ncbi:MAG: hypothetical protein ACPIGG_08165 [Akkermansiaceae bacterium]